MTEGQIKKLEQQAKLQRNDGHNRMKWPPPQKKDNKQNWPYNRRKK